MFKKFLFLVQSINSCLHSLLVEMQNIRRSSINDYFYVVQIRFGDSILTSDRLSTLTAVNDFINGHISSNIPTRINIVKRFDDGL